jgi:hypothetical protein
MLLHATVIAIAAQGVILVGQSGAGKSALAARLIERGAWLIADDRTRIEQIGSELWASCPQTIRGQIEIRGVGLIRAPTQSAARLRLACDLDSQGERLPDPSFWTPCPGAENAPSIPCVHLDANRPDAVEAVLAALVLVREWEDSPAP